jgi:predicted helicase
MTISEYLENINKRYKTDIAREHSYRGDLQTLLESLLNHVMVTNEPKRIDVGAPDYILTRNNIPVGYIEAKDIGDPDLDGKKKNKEQFDRYKAVRDPFIFTDYLDFHLYLEGEFITSIRIAEIENGKIIPKPENFDAFCDLIRDFATQPGQPIRSASKLSKMMAGKARLLSDVIKKSLLQDEKSDHANKPADNTLREQLAAFKKVLIHDIDAKEFANIYAQTIAYGMFAARLNDLTLDSFSRQEAAELIPKTNPFLRKLFQYIAGYDLDERITWIVDGLADIFRATDVAALLQDFGKTTQKNDPIINFYENFLAEFDPDMRVRRGVYYTPVPVVSFIVQAVSDILKDEFNLKDGLANTSKTTVKVNTDIKDKRSSSGYRQVERDVHKVQILDPAAGTGTFLAEVINQIYRRFEGQQGIWPNYVDEHLIPRLNGFELLMASYAMAHLKLSMVLKETGYDCESSRRFQVYLTNSLEEHHPDTQTLFAQWLSNEANEANRVKRDTPVMVVLGNPPYSVSSRNKGEWIESLMKDYKKGLNEKNIQPLSDDYIKFIRYGQHFIERNGEGILAYISNNRFTYGVIHRQMRKSLLQSFDKIYVLDLHGSSKEEETAPDGTIDENVFDIRQGVSINLFIKSNKNNYNCAKVLKHDFFGKREEKYKKLKESLSGINWKEIEIREPAFKFKTVNFDKLKSYQNFFATNALFKEGNVGFTSARDKALIKFDRKTAKKLVEDMLSLPIKKIRKKYDFGRDSRDYKVQNAIEDLRTENRNGITIFNFRPFDYRFSYYSSHSKGFFSYPRYEIMQHFQNKKNVGLVVTRLNRQKSHGYFWITNEITERHILDSAGDSTSIFPLYLYPKTNGQQTLDGKPERKPNLDPEIVQKIADDLGLKFVPESPDNRPDTAEREAFAPIDLLDYIYAVLHSPAYREKYKEFLKIDFPRVPYPKNPQKFWELVKLGSELRQIHLLEHPVVNNFITTYPKSGDNKITKRLTKTQPGFIPEQSAGMRKADNRKLITSADHRYPNEPLGKVQINNEQYFGHVPQKAWDFYIGGYQPAQKWLKDRRGREGLSFEETQHYQKIIVALMETGRLMQEIDEIELE